MLVVTAWRLASVARNFEQFIIWRIYAMRPLVTVSWRNLEHVMSLNLVVVSTVDRLVNGFGSRILLVHSWAARIHEPPWS